MSSTKQDLQLIEPPSHEGLMPITLGWQWWTAIAIAVLGLMGIAWLLWTRHKSTQNDPGRAHREATREALAALATCSSESTREAATECSLILRRYLAKLTGDPALFETHEEWISRHDALQDMSETTRGEIHEQLSRLAGWKYSPDEASIEPAEVVEQSRRLVQTLKQEVEP
ncbi:MAG: DUF4381 family protein [Akkermansiaceae bacterium]|nr:DUF4381 family protein [Akkermansiaceae bacterium]